MTDATVGVVLPVRNGDAFVREAIDSVVAQTWSDLDVVVVDDASDDATAEAVADVADPRVTLLRNETRRGVAVSRNRGADHVAGDRLAFIDHDDVWHPEKLARHQERHAATGAALVYSDIRHVDADGTAVRVERKPEPARPGEPLVKQLFVGEGDVITTMSSVTVDRSAWTAVDGEEPAFDIAGDLDFYLRLAGGHAFARVPAALVDKRRHGANLSDDYRRIFDEHRKIVTRSVERYGFLSAADVRRKRARMPYHRATEALAAGEPAESWAYARRSLGHGVRIRPALVMALAAIDRATGPASAGGRLFRAYERFAG